MLALILVSTAIAAIIYYVFIFRFEYWKKRGVPNPSVSYLFGNIGESLILKKSIGQIYDAIYNKYPTLKYVGFYKVGQPGIILRDPEIVKEVLLKSFGSFHANDVHVNEDIDPISSRNPFFSRGERWKTSRSQLTPCFTSRQIRSMVPLMEAVSDNLVKYLENTRTVCVDAIEMSNKYSCDVVASCAFGLDANSFQEAETEFRKMGKLVLSPSPINTIRHLLLFAIPSLAKVFKTKFMPDKAADYFMGIISQTLKYRKANNITRGDFLDMMVEIKSKLGENVFTELDITSHAIGFVTDGLETSSIVLSYALYELGVNLDMQEKLRKEVDLILEKHKGVLSYDALQEMVYLEQVFCENIRKHPPGIVLVKLCTQSFSLPSPDGRGPDVTIEPNISVVIPVYSLHHDPKYFPHPERFDPERFSEENKEKLTKYTYLPFGEGPRTCVGQRLATAQIKVAIAKLVSKFEIRANNKTKTPNEIDPTYILLSPKGGIWVDFHKRR